MDYEAILSNVRALQEMSLATDNAKISFSFNTDNEPVTLHVEGFSLVVCCDNVIEVHPDAVSAAQDIRITMQEQNGAS